MPIKFLPASLQLAMVINQQAYIGTIN